MCSLETGNSRGERCDNFHWVENFQRPEYISTIDPRIHMTVDLTMVWRIDTSGESEGIEFETLEA
jgi:hypothetical protein